jgi:hypothetical protein
VIGKVIIITAFSQELENVFYEFKDDRKYLVKMLKKNLELYRKTPATLTRCG